MINKNILISCGLTSEQSTIYLFLIESGLCTAKIISQKTGIGRALTYKIINQLIELNLIEKRDDVGKIARFLPKHPQPLKEIIQARQTDINQKFDSINQIFGELTSRYNLLTGKPNVQYFEGETGLQEIYDDILDINQNILVISSPIQDGKSDVLYLIREQINKQVAQNIQTKAITPIGHGQELTTPITDDEKYLISRKPISRERLNIPAQIIIYGEKVAITNFKESIITVLIDSKYINETFKALFGYIWNHSH